ncbi:uncharacterized protein TNCV_1409821 [Trichonephila clavipes]|uniref:Uncharacterized protein n=1 Tax=Trichonephila clavipes TaxID=2585209 RepID=A0A8X6R3D5_TRICX|nr:uncharacterized protein TNCV_1409821 [Trichonephila clavipes]
MTAQRYVYEILQPHVLPLMQRLPGAIFQQDNARPHMARVVTRLSPHCYYPSLACPMPRFVSNRAYLGSFGTVSWASYEFDRTRNKVTANMERNVKKSYKTCMPKCSIVPHRAFALEGVQEDSLAADLGVTNFDAEIEAVRQAICPLTYLSTSYGRAAFIVDSQSAILTLCSLRNSDSMEVEELRKKFMKSKMLTGLLYFNGFLAIATSQAMKNGLCLQTWL